MGATACKHSSACEAARTLYTSQPELFSITMP